MRKAKVPKCHTCSVATTIASGRVANSQLYWQNNYPGTGAANCGLRMELIWPNVLMASVNDCLIASFYTLAAFYTLDETRRSISDAKIQGSAKRLVRGCEIFRHTYRDITGKRERVGHDRMRRGVGWADEAVQCPLPHPLHQPAAARPLPPSQIQFKTGGFTSSHDKSAALRKL